MVVAVSTYRRAKETVGSPVFSAGPAEREEERRRGPRR
jgi:hypothetical protein